MIIKTVNISCIKLKSMYKIEKNVKPPTTKNSFPFESMKVGDSFLEKDFNKFNSLKVAATIENKKNNGTKFFSVRKDVAGYRCFRTK